MSNQIKAVCTHGNNKNDIFKFYTDTILLYPYNKHVIILTDQFNYLAWLTISERDTIWVEAECDWHRTGGCGKCINVGY